MRHPLIIDLETKHTFREYSDPSKLGISVIGIYDYTDRSFKSFTEKTIPSLYPLLENASYIIGYNSNNFDLAVLQGYYPGDIKQFKTFDLLEDIRFILGKRLSLNDVVNATLNKRKSGHGLHAIHLYKEGQIKKLIKYCLDDVSLTKELFEYGVTHNEIFYPSGAGKSSIKVSWKKYLEESDEKKDISLTLPF